MFFTQDFRPFPVLMQSLEKQVRSKLKKKKRIVKNVRQKSL